MKLTDVVNQLQLVLPKYTDYFSNTLSIANISTSGNTAIISTSVSHGLVNGQAVTISDVAFNNDITSVSQDGLIFTFGTAVAHDLTLNYPGYETVEINGFTDTNWNGSFSLVAVPNRTSFSVRSTNTIPTLNGNEYVREVRVDGVNGRYSVTVVAPPIFTIAGSFIDGVYTGGTVKTAVRIAGSVNIERAIQEYTEQNVNDLWMFVVMADAEVSKSRNAYSDSVATIANGEDVRVRLIDGFSVFIVKNVSQEISAVAAMDIARHDLLSPILKSLYGARFDTGLSGCSDFIAILTSHNFVEYDRATFVYQYTFQITNDMTLDDSVINEDTRAFRDISYTQTTDQNNEDVEELTVLDIQLDS